MSVPDPAIYGNGWKDMADVPTTPDCLVLLLIPDRPERMVVKGIHINDRWLLEDGKYMPDHLTPIGWHGGGREQFDW